MFCRRVRREELPLFRRLEDERTGGLADGRGRHRRGLVPAAPADTASGNPAPLQEPGERPAPEERAVLKEGRGVFGAGARRSSSAPASAARTASAAGASAPSRSRRRAGRHTPSRARRPSRRYPRRRPRGGGGNPSPPRRRPEAVDVSRDEDERKRRGLPRAARGRGERPQVAGRLLHRDQVEAERLPRAIDREGGGRLDGRDAPPGPSRRPPARQGRSCGRRSSRAGTSPAPRRPAPRVHRRRFSRGESAGRRRRRASPWPRRRRTGRRRAWPVCRRASSRRRGRSGSRTPCSSCSGGV